MRASSFRAATTTDTRMPGGFKLSEAGNRFAQRRWYNIESVIHKKRVATPQRNKSQTLMLAWH
jgi:hypothetical protein